MDKTLHRYNDPTLPLLSPQMGDYAGLPPLHICVGTYEIHLDDCENVARKAKRQGVDVILSKWPRMVHAFPILSPLFPEAKNATAEICEFAKSHIIAGDESLKRLDANGKEFMY